MATLDGGLADSTIDAPAGTKGRFVTVASSESSLGASGTTRYKMQASCSSAPSGYITWVNTTGDDVGKPSCSAGAGPSRIVASW